LPADDEARVRPARKGETKGFVTTNLTTRTTLAIAALLVAWTIAAVHNQARAEDLLNGGEDTQVGPQRRGESFEFRRHLPIIDNPYCEITTYIIPQFDEQASSTTDVRDQPVIVIDASMLKQSLPYAHFLMAHECCHHTLGHVRLTSESLGQLGPQPFYYIRPLLRNMELDADTCAVKMLKQTSEPDAIEVAREAMLQFGNMPTGAYYPTGVERANNIARAAAAN
jgi:hypothetical protein